MTSPNSDRPPRGRRLLKIAAVTVGAATAIVGGAAVIGGWLLLSNRLTPMVEERLTQLLERDVELGKLTGIGPTSVSFSEAVLNPTATDPTSATAETAQVTFNPLQALFQRELDLGLRLVEAEGYLEQDPEEGWLGIEIPEFEPVEDPLVKVRLDEVEIVDSQLTLVPLAAEGEPPAPLTVAGLTGQVNLDAVTVAGQDAQEISFDAIASPQNGGRLNLTGEIQPVAGDKNLQRHINLGVDAQGVAAGDAVSFLLPTLNQQNLNISAPAGRVSGQWTVAFRPEQPVTVVGSGSVNNGQLRLGTVDETVAFGNTIEDINAQARFSGTTITIDRATSRYGDLNAEVTGTVNWREGYDLEGQVNDLDLAQILADLDVSTPIELAGVFDSDVTITGAIGKPRIAARLEAIETAVVDRVTFDQLIANVTLDPVGFDRLRLTQLQAQTSQGGTVTGSGTVAFGENLPQLDFDLQARNVAADRLLTLYDVSSGPATLGRVSGDVNIAGPSNQLVTTLDVQAPQLAYGGSVYPARGTATFANGGLTIPQLTLQTPGGGALVAQGQTRGDRWRADIDANNVPLAPLTANLANPLEGRANGQFSLSGPTQNLSLSTIIGQGTYGVQLARGSVDGAATLTDGRWRTSARLEQVGLGQFATQLGGTTSGEVNLSGPVQQLSLATVDGQGDLVFSNGLASFSPQLESFSQPVSSQFAWNGQELLLEQVRSDQILARGVVSPQISGNQIQGIRQFVIDIDDSDYALGQLPTPVPLTGQASFTGRLAGSPQAPSLRGSLLLEDFTVGGAAFDPVLLGPVAYTSQAGAKVDLVGQNNLDADGTSDRIFLSAQNLQNFDFDLRWQQAEAQGTARGGLLQANLSQLPLQALGLPPIRRLGGSFQGQLSSRGDLIADLNQQTFMGEIVIEDPSIGYLAAEQLEAQLAYRDRRLTVAQGLLLFGSCVAQLPEPSNGCDERATDSLYEFSGGLNIDTFAYDARVVASSGRVQDLLQALAIDSIQDLTRLFQSPTWLDNAPSAAEIPGILATQAVGSPGASLLDQLRRLSEIQALQEQQQLAAEEEPLPPIGQLQGVFDADIRISGTPQQLPELAFEIDGRRWSWGRDFVADNIVARGQLDNGLLTLQPLRLTTELPPDETGQPQTAVVNVAGSFALQGETTAGLQLEAAQLPIAAVRDIFNLPLSLDGRLNGRANLSGQLGNPRLRGDISLVNGSINQTPIDTASSQFLYEDARLLLQGQLTQIDNPDPLTISGSIPYAFDFMTVRPASDSIGLKIDVADQGLALLNALNNQITWESGQGEVSLDVGGSLSNLVISGIVNVDQAVLRSRLLPDPLTNVEGFITFERNQIVVRRLQGSYGDGQLAAAGILPLGWPPIISESELARLGASSDPAAGDDSSAAGDISIDPTGPLTVRLDNAALDLAGLYEGQVDGLLVIGGSLLTGGPQLGGFVTLADGRVFLPDGSAPGGGSEAGNQPLIVPRFANLRISLDRNIRIQQSNLLNVVAQGDLNLTGPLQPFRAIEPEGTIRLRSGRINLLTTTFRLAGRDNQARFTPERGIADPLLDLSLRTSVTEAQRSSAIEASTFASSEINDTSLDPFSGTTSLQTIRVRANYQGTASKLLQSLFVTDSSSTVISLSSSPPRSRQEIINLLSGSYISALQSGEGVLNFFGGALLTQIQDFVSRTLNLSEFRLFPITAASRFASEDNRGSTLDVATEVGIDLTNNTTLSLLKILTDSTPTEFNLRYRLTDEFTIRTTTNLDDVNRVFLEFETRF